MSDTHTRIQPVTSIFWILLWCTCIGNYYYVTRNNLGIFFPFPFNPTLITAKSNLLQAFQISGSNSIGKGKSLHMLPLTTRLCFEWSVMQHRWSVSETTQLKSFVWVPFNTGINAGLLTAAALDASLGTCSNSTSSPVTIINLAKQGHILSDFQDEHTNQSAEIYKITNISWVISSRVQISRSPGAVCERKFSKSSQENGMLSLNLFQKQNES